MKRARAIFPISFMGIANLPFGLFGAVVLITVPQMLAAQHVAEPVIASITAAAMIPTFCGFLLAPLLDVRFSRRRYALVFGLLTSVAAWLALTNIANSATLTKRCPLLLHDRRKGAFISSNIFKIGHLSLGLRANHFCAEISAVCCASILSKTVG